MRNLMRAADGQQHMRRVKRTARAGRTARRADALRIQQHQHALAFDKAEAEIHVARQAVGAMAVQLRMRNLRLNAADQMIAHRSNLRHRRVHVLHRLLSRLAHADNARHVARARAAVLLLCAAIHKRKQLHAFANVEEPHTLRAVELVRADRQQIDVHLFDIQRNVTKRLHRIRVEDHAVTLADLANGLQRLNRADLVVRRHDGDEHGIRADGRFHGLRRNHTVRVHGQNGNVESFAFQRLGAVQNRVMLNRRDNQMTPLFLVRAHYALERPVVALRAAAGEENLRALGADDVGNLLARLLHRRVAGVGEAVCAGRIGILLGQVWHHGLQGSAAQPRCRGVIHINHKILPYSV